MTKLLDLVFWTLLMAFCLMTVHAQTTEFTYQGSLKNSGLPANGNFDFEFRLYDALTGGSQSGPFLSRTNVTVIDGIFAARLDFGTTPFVGPDRYLEIRVRNSGGGGHTILDPRQRVGTSPFAIKSLLADTATSASTATNATTAITATNATQLGGVAANQYVVTTDPRMTDARTPTAGSANYIQNQNAGAQAVSNFNVSGTGTANILNAASQINIGANRILSNAGSDNLFAGVGAGSVNTGGGSNSFFGANAGSVNTQGDANSFFGANSGDANTFGSFNSFFGRESGGSNTLGTSNSFFGSGAGFNNETGGSNSFFGTASGSVNTTGAENAFFGMSAGNSNATGSSNTIIGSFADVGSNNLSFATAIGAGSRVLASNTIALGRSDGSDIVRIPGRLALLDLGTAGSTALCRNGLISGPQIATCSSSLRYKTNIGSFGVGLDLIKQLRPITFDWKDGGMHDLGLGAEDVAVIEPLLVTYNTKGEVEGVKYDRIGVVLVNAVKEQQAQIEAQQKQINEQKAEIDGLRSLVCLQNPTVEICRAKK